MPESDRGAPICLERINSAPMAEFLDLMGGLVEHSPWVAEEVSDMRPFASVWALHGAMLDRIRGASRERQIALMRLHPELAGLEATTGTMTVSSNVEQARLGLLSLSREHHDRLRLLNAAYRQKFGFPFIIAVRLHKDLDSIFAALQMRLEHGVDMELAENLCEIGEVLRGRLARLFALPMGWLSTHVLNAAAGMPAVGMTFELFVHEGGGWNSIGQGVTNGNGRPEQPLLVDGMMRRGVYQLEFGVGAYFRAKHAGGDELPFLDQVPLRFGIHDPDLHYHLPLVCTPWTYSTYRGS